MKTYRFTKSPNEIVSVEANSITEAAAKILGVAKPSKVMGSKDTFSPGRGSRYTITLVRDVQKFTFTDGDMSVSVEATGPVEAAAKVLGVTPSRIGKVPGKKDVYSVRGQLETSITMVRDETQVVEAPPPSESKALKVCDLMDQLSQCDPGAEVVVSNLASPGHDLSPVEVNPQSNGSVVLFCNPLP